MNGPSAVISRSSWPRVAIAMTRVDRAEQVDQHGQVVGPHVEHRAAAGLIVELRIGMPVLHAAPHHEGGAGHRLADGALIHQPARPPAGGAEESVRRRAEQQAALRRLGDKAAAVARPRLPAAFR